MIRAIFLIAAMLISIVAVTPASAGCDEHDYVGNCGGSGPSYGGGAGG